MPSGMPQVHWHRLRLQALGSEFEFHDKLLKENQ
jgi:hypothetical protein